MEITVQFKLSVVLLFGFDFSDGTYCSVHLVYTYITVSPINIPWQLETLWYVLLVGCEHFSWWNNIVVVNAFYCIVCKITDDTFSKFLLTIFCWKHLIIWNVLSLKFVEIQLEWCRSVLILFCIYCFWYIRQPWHR